MARVVINGTTYENPEKIEIPIENGGGAKQPFFDTSDATGAAADTKAGATVYGPNGKQNGSMPVNGDTSGVINTKNGSVTIPAGHTSGGTVQLSETAKASIVSANIKNGAEIMGVQGDPNVVDTSIPTGGATSSTMLAGAKGFVNGALVEGAATVPSVTFDSVNKVLTIV